MSRLHVWVDWITLSLGRVILMGLVAGYLFITGEPSAKKWSVAPGSKMAYFTALHTFSLLKMVVAIGSFLFSSLVQEYHMLMSLCALLVGLFILCEGHVSLLWHGGCFFGNRIHLIQRRTVMGLLFICLLFCSCSGII